MDILMKEQPMGEFSAPYYYSVLMPKDSPRASETKWDRRTSLIFDRLKRDTAGEADAYRAQKRLVELGFLDPWHVDGRRGRQTDYAINRWKENTKDSYWRWKEDVHKDEDLLLDDEEREATAEEGRMQLEKVRTALSKLGFLDDGRM